MPLRAFQVGDVETPRCEHLSSLAHPAADDLVAKDTWRCVLQLSLRERRKPVIVHHMMKHGSPTRDAWPRPVALHLRRRWPPSVQIPPGPPGRQKPPAKPVHARKVISTTGQRPASNSAIGACQRARPSSRQAVLYRFADYHCSVASCSSCGRVYSSKQTVRSLCRVRRAGNRPSRAY